MKIYEIDHDTWVELILEAMKGCSLEELIQIPGVWEEVSEYFKNEALEIWERRKREKK